jgi:hypothetical protein
MIGPDVALFTVTREFEALVASRPMCPSPNVSLPEQSVVETFALQTDGTWRNGILGREPGFDSPTPASYGGPQDRPWASFGASNGPWLRMPAFRPRGRIQIRYTVWSQGVLGHGRRHWMYCDSDDDGIVPDVVVQPGDASVVVRPDPESKKCVDVEKADPRPTELSARFGTYRVGGGWWSRLELSAPEALTKGPTLPDDAPVVFVLDASRSMEQRGGVTSQLAIARAYLVNTPSAGVEVVLTSRTAERVFGRFVRVNELETVLGGRLAQVALKNGSFLDRGGELAADVLASEGKPGRVILMTDGQLRSRFDRGAAVRTLKRAPAGTVVHLVYPNGWSSGRDGIRHFAPDGLDALSAALGGASYAVDVDTTKPSSSELGPMLKRLVGPDRVESMELRDLQSGAEWPDISDGRTLEGEIAAGDGQIASVFSTKPPPGRLAITGFVWGKKIEIHFQRDPSFERLLPRIATSDGDLMECHASDDHLRRALRERFLAPGLRFWLSGSGDTDELTWGSSGSYDPCGGGASGGGIGPRLPKPDELPPDTAAALDRCHLVRSASGTLRVKVETYGVEVVDVYTEGGHAEDRRCAEEALWAVALPDDFNQHRWPLTKYEFALSPSANKGP